MRRRQPCILDNALHNEEACSCGDTREKDSDEWQSAVNIRSKIQGIGDARVAYKCLLVYFWRAHLVESRALDVFSAFRTQSPLVNRRGDGSSDRLDPAWQLFADKRNKWRINEREVRSAGRCSKDELVRRVQFLQRCLRAARIFNGINRRSQHDALRTH